MNLDDVQRNHLHSLKLSSTYETILDVLEKTCQLAETDLLNIPPEQHDKIIAYHNRAQAFRLMFEHFQKTVDSACGEYCEVKPPLDLAANYIDYLTREL